MYTLINPVYAYIIAGGLFAILLLLLVIAKGDKVFCTNPITIWIYETFNCYNTSAILWNGLMWIAFISTGVVWPEIASIVSSLLSLYFFLLVLLSSDGEYDRALKNQTWFFMAWIFYIFAIIIGIGFGLYWIWENTIGRFNNWLDAYRGNKAFDKWKQDNTRPDARNN